ncbi:uncharacterized protein [Temnothorax longispinosus]|uniref:uncharacterized protein n=1 Tax=Temnothorax longispinosus TaxID=300112 RepID=UPI003A9994BE
MKKVKWGGIKLGEEKVYDLEYADDMVLLAEGEDEMRSMMERLERYLDKKRLELNAEKTKIMRFRKGGRRMVKRDWWWKGRKVEEVKEFRYLGYTLQRNGGQEAHVKERVKKAAAVMGQVWGIGKRRFGKDWGRRLWLFDKLVWTVMGYGVEIWGWEEREGMKRLEERYLRWVLGVDRRTPGYLLRKELQRKKLRGRAEAGRRLEEGGGSELARRCWEKVKERSKRRGRLSDWEEGRKKYLSDRGLWEEGERERKGGEETRLEEMVKWEREVQRAERWERIKESRYGKWYKEVKEKGVP